MNNTTAQPQPSNQTPTHKRTPTSAVFGKLKNIPKWLIVTIVALFVAGLAYLLFRPEPAPPNYLTATAEMGDIEETVMATGKVKAIDSVAVGAQVSGEVTKLYVDVGSEVKQGDLIAQIDENSQSNALTNAQTTLKQSQSQLRSAQASLVSRQGDVEAAMASITQRQAELKKAETNHQRLASLIEIDAVSREQFDNAAVELEVARANLHSAHVALNNARAAVAGASADIDNQKGNVAKSQTDLNTAQKNLGYTTIRAPMSGTVVSVSQKQGTTVSAAQAAPTIVTLADLTRMRINAKISEADVINIKPGMPARFNIIGDTKQQFDVVLTGIEPAPETISTSTSTDEAVYYIGYLDVDNRERRLRIDMTAQVTIIINQVKNVLIIPSAAIITENGKSTVRVVGDDGIAHSVDVVVGVNNRVNAEIKSGLKVGDRVVISDNDQASELRGPPMM